MTKKIINIKNVLRIIISIMVIFSMAKSCAKAFTYDDIKEYVNYTADYYTSNTTYQNMKNWINAPNLVTQINNYASNYNYYECYYGGYYFTVRLYRTTADKITSNGTRLDFNKSTTYRELDLYPRQW